MKTQHDIPLYIVTTVIVCFFLYSLHFAIDAALTPIGGSPTAILGGSND